MIFIRLDEGISQHIADFARRIGIPPHVQIETPAALDERSLSDESWMELFAKRGRARDLRAAFSADGFTPAERALAETLQITLFTTPKMFWRPLKSIGQVAYFLRWLPRLIELIETSAPGTYYRLPPSFNPARKLKAERPMLGRTVVRKGRPKTPKPPPRAPLLDGK